MSNYLPINLKFEWNKITATCDVGSTQFCKLWSDLPSQISQTKEIRMEPDTRQNAGLGNANHNSGHTIPADHIPLPL